MNFASDIFGNGFDNSNVLRSVSSVTNDASKRPKILPKAGGGRFIGGVSSFRLNEAALTIGDGLKRVSLTYIEWKQ